MLRGIILCGLGALTMSLGVKQLWDFKKASVKEIPAEEQPAPVEAIDTVVSE